MLMYLIICNMRLAVFTFFIEVMLIFPDYTTFRSKTSIPCFMLITTASVHDVNVLDNLQYEIGSFYILYRGYVDFSRLHNIQIENLNSMFYADYHSQCTRC